jgi:hypothetical protein
MLAILLLSAFLVKGASLGVGARTSPPANDPAPDNLPRDDSRKLLDALAPGEWAQHLPGLPISLTLPLARANSRFLFFPRSDSAADFGGSVRRCQVLGARLWRPRTDRFRDDTQLLEREMLSCAIDGPVFVGSPHGALDDKDEHNNDDGSGDQDGSRDSEAERECQVLMPGGILVRSHNLCARHFGSICQPIASADSQ